MTEQNTLFRRKSILAKLMATENIVVRQANFDTAYFDTKRRVLGLPNWQDMPASLYDMLVGHEVGHALDTPTDWLAHPDAKRVPKSFINITEDIRIEKLILRRFPGLLNTFMRGYDDVLQRDLFGLKNRNVNSLSLIDRLNIHAKARGKIAVEFSSEEQPYVDRAMAVETYDDAVASAVEIARYMNSKVNVMEIDIVTTLGGVDPEFLDEENEDSAAMPDEDNVDDTEKDAVSTEDSDQDEDAPNKSVLDAPDVLDMSETQETDDDEDDTDSDIGSDSEGEGSGLGGKLTKSENFSDKNEEKEAKEEKEEEEEDFSHLEEAVTYESMEKVKKLHVSKDNVIVNFPEESDLDELVVSADMITSTRKRIEERYNRPAITEFSTTKKFRKETKQTVATIYREYLMRKAAYRQARASESRSGSLDTAKLHNYKFDDNLFKSVTTLADAKSHGIVILVDCSGSMSMHMRSTVKQALILAQFCSVAGIPFDIYGFGYRSSFLTAQENEKYSDSLDQKDLENADKIVPVLRLTNLIHALGSTMSKKTYTEQFEAIARFIYGKGHYSVCGLEANAGGTPLNESLLILSLVMKQFQRKTNVQKTTLVTITDGDGFGFSLLPFNSFSNEGKHSGAKTMSISFMDKTFTFKASASLFSGRRGTRILLDMFRDVGIDSINFFLGSKSAIYADLDKSGCYSDSVENKSARLQIRRYSVCSLDKIGGYTRKISIPVGKAFLGRNSDTFFVEDDASTAAAAKAMSKFMVDRSITKIIARKVGETIT